MFELILLIISLLCLFSSAEASVTFLLIAVGVSAYKRRSLQDELTELQASQKELGKNLRREIDLIDAKRETLAAELDGLRGSISGHDISQLTPARKPIVDSVEPRPTSIPHMGVETPKKEADARSVDEAPEILRTPPVAAEAAPRQAKFEPPAIPETQPANYAKPVEPVLPAIENASKIPIVGIPAQPVVPVPPPLPSASHAIPTPHRDYRVAPPQRPPAKPIGERLKSLFAFEEMLGRNWASKLGISFVVLGLALLGNYQFGQTAGGKVGLLLMIAAALLGGGIYLERNERYELIGRTGIGGGWAIFFFTAYAMHHVQAMRILNSESTDLLIMLGVAVAMALHTLRYKSQLITGLAFLLAYSTIALSHDTVYALSAGAVLAVGLVIIAVRMQWYELEIFGILSSYLNHFYWLYKILGSQGSQHHWFPEFTASTAILLVYWATYRCSYVIRKTASDQQEATSSVAAILNTLLLLAVMRFQSLRPELAFYALLVLGGMEFALGQIPITRKRHKAFVLLTILGAALMIVAVPFKFSGNNVALLWFIGAEVFLAAGIFQREVVFRRVGLVAGILVGLHVLIVDSSQLYQARLVLGLPTPLAGILLLTSGFLFYLNSLYVTKRWPSLFSGDLETKLLFAQSYFGAMTLTLAAWALTIRDWTAVALISIVVGLAWFSRRLGSRHLLVQSSVIAIAVFFRTLAINLHFSEMFGTGITHISGRYISIPIIAIGFYLAADWIVSERNSLHLTLRGLFAWAGTICLGFLVFGEVPYEWQPLAYIGLAIVLTEASILFEYPPLGWHVHCLAATAVVDAVLYEGIGARGWQGLNATTLVLSVTAAAAYWLSWRARDKAEALRFRIRDGYLWLGSFFYTWLLWKQLPDAWIAVGWLGFGVVLTLVGRRLTLSTLSYQENLLAACVLPALFFYNYPLEVQGTFNLRMVTVIICAAGLYAISRKSAPVSAAYAKQAGYLHTWAATGLLALLAWYEAPTAWLIVVWSIFALSLAAVGRRWEIEEFSLQAHTLAALAVMRAVTVNLYIEDKVYGFSLRLISVGLLIGCLYALSRLVLMPKSLRDRELQHVYTWVASFLVSLLMWYELHAVSVALGWGLFALVLFELGYLREIRQLRMQSYVGLFASFVRIFFVNLTAGSQAGEFLSPRITTVVPLALIYFFVYAQQNANDRIKKSYWSIDTILVYIASITVASLLYFQVPGGWIVTAWSVMAFVLLAATLLSNREVFLQQAVLLALALLLRGLMHNLFGASYFSEGSWTGRYLELGSAAFTLLASLPFAVKLKNKYPVRAEQGRMAAILAKAARRPEQFVFFVPIVLLTLMLALKMRAGMVTAAWGIEGVLVVLLALAVSERSFRLSGLALLILCVGKISIIDAWQLAPRDRYITFIILGMALLGVSFLYSKYREAIRQFL